jgi:hypothetical protein
MPALNAEKLKLGPYPTPTRVVGKFKIQRPPSPLVNQHRPCYG